MLSVLNRWSAPNKGEYKKNKISFTFNYCLLKYTNILIDFFTLNIILLLTLILKFI